MADDVDIRVRLRGGKIAAAEARLVAAGIDDIGDKSTRTSGAMAHLSRVAAGFRAPMQAVGEASRVGAMYLAGFSAAAVGAGTYLGLQFNSRMEQSTVAFTKFLGSTRAARRYLNQLYDLAAKTPFEFPQLTDAAAKMLGFGFSARQSYSLLTDIGDAAAGVGAGAEGIDRITLALGQMRAKGRVQGDELLQLTEAGIPALKMLQREMGLTGSELSDRMRKGALDADAAIAALQRGMRRRYGGMAREQSKTFAGQLSSMKDMGVQMLGRLTEPLFIALRDRAFPAIQKAMPGIERALGGAMRWVGENGPKAFAAGKRAVEGFLAAIEPAKPFWENVLRPLLEGFAIGVIGSVVGAVRVAVPVFRLLMRALGWVGEKLRPLRGAFRVVGAVIGFMTSGPVLKAVGGLGKLGGVFRLVGTAARIASWPIRLFAQAHLFVFRNVVRVVSFIGGRFFGVIGRIPGVLGKAVSGFRNFVGGGLRIVTDGVGRILGFLGGLGAKFTSAGKKLWDWLAKGITNAIGAGLGFAGDIGKAVANAVIGFLNSAIPNRIPVPGAPDIPLPDNPIPMLAEGGVIGSRGTVMVGEAGPELLTLPKGAQVTPLPKRGPIANAGAASAALAARPVIAQVFLDRRQIAQALATAVGDANNRR